MAKIVHKSRSVRWTRYRQCLLKLGVILLLSLCFIQCASPSRPQSEKVRFSKGDQPGEKGKVVTQVELQQDLQRFTTGFMDRLNQASSNIVKEPEETIRNNTIRQTLLYMTSAISITIEPLPELGLLDMLVFISLNKEIFTEYWIPKVFGRRGEPIENVFKVSEREIWNIAKKVMNGSQINEVKRLIHQWKVNNPTQYRVEGIRLGSFSEAAGAIELKRSQEVHGLLSSVSSAVESVDEALLLADRALFLVQRMPFLLRLHARVATFDTVSDVKYLLPSAEPILEGSSSLLDKASIAAGQATQFAKSLYPLIPKNGLLIQYLSSSERITDSLLKLLSEMQGAEPVKRIEILLRHAFFYFLSLGVGLILFWWAGYFFAKQALTKSTLRTKKELDQSKPDQAA